MCGIAGQARSDGRPVSRELLVRMCAAIEHRGPDSRGIHLDSGVGLGIQRLRVIDLATGDQPIFNEDGTVAVVLNGEIYNFRELRDRLERAGHRFSTRSDTEAIVHLYEERGPACVEELHGMFAFAIWDATERRLIVARDRVGKKPLFYAHREDAFTFASELNSVMEDDELPREFDHQALDAYLAYRCIPAPMTAFRAVRKLPPASVLVFEDGKFTIRRYWQLDFSRKRTITDLGDVHEEVREQIRRAVRRRMIADVPLGAFLSGGIDSSAVVAAMAEASPRPVKTFSIGFDRPEFDELHKARQIAQTFATEHHEFSVKPEALKIIPKIVRHYGEPFGDPSALPSFYLAELARRHVTVALNGDGGDESFGGYPRYVSNLLLHRADRLPLGAGRLLAAVARRVTMPRSGRVQSALSRARRLTDAMPLDPAERYAGYLTQLAEIDRATLYTDKYRELVGGTQVSDVVRTPWSAASGDSLLDVLLEVDINTYLPDDLLVKMDIATMAHSLEARSPLLDHELMEFAASLPDQYKVRGMEKKAGLRDALRGWIPDEILDSRKQGFQVPIADWFRGELYGYARDVLLDPAVGDRGWFRADRVGGMLERHAEGIEDHSKMIWSLLMLELWLREVAEGPSRLPAAAAGV